jgi:ribosomal protein L35
MKKRKQKVRKSVIRRFKITKNGKVLFRGSHVKHLRRKKRKGQVRAQKVPKKMKGAWQKKIKRLAGR